MNEREYNRLKSEIQAEYRRKLDALELVWKMSNASRNGTQSTQAPNALVGKGQLLKAVRNALADMQGDSAGRCSQLGVPRLGLTGLAESSDLILCVSFFVSFSIILAPSFCDNAEFLFQRRFLIA